jgi:REP element-mobilizing transposase RayT
VGRRTDPPSAFVSVLHLISPILLCMLFRMGARRTSKAQTNLPFKPGRGGLRLGAGRKPRGPRPSQPHKQRPYLSARTPVHVTIRVVPSVSSLRTRAMYRALRWATLTTARRETFRIVHMSIQRTHVHLVVEARDRMALARGMQGFQISAARLLNRAGCRRGTVFPDRYHAHQLLTPSEVRHAVSYVLNNWRRHRENRRVACKLDPFSSAIAFPDWRELSASPFLYRPPPRYEPLIVWRPRTFLLLHAFRRAPRPSVYAIPASAR